MSSTHSLPSLLANLATPLPALRSPGQNFIEALESRQMLSSITHPTSNVIIEGEFHTFTAKSAAKDRTFTDNHNNKVLFTLSGAGTGTIFQANDGEIVTLELSDTKAVTNLNVNVTKNKNGTGVTSIADIQIESGGLNSLNAANVNLVGSFVSQAPVKSITLGDVGGLIQSNFNIIGTSTGADKTTLTFGAMHDVSIRTFTNVTSFKAQSWVDDNELTDSFEASSLGTLTITGRNEIKTKGEVTTPALPGDFESNISLTYTVPIGTAPNSPAAKPTVTSITVSGTVIGDWDFKAHKVSNIGIKAGASGDWFSKSDFGPVSIGGSALDLSVTGTKSIASFKAGHAGNVDLSTDGAIGAITTIDWIDGSITADKVASITTTGHASVISKGIIITPVIPGDFKADLLIKGTFGSATLPSVGSITIKGSALGDKSYKGLDTSGDWIIVGGVGAIKITEGTQHFFLDVRHRDKNLGSVASLTISGKSTDFRADVHGNSGAISIAGAEGFALLVGEGVPGGNLASFSSSMPIEGTTLNVHGAIGSITTNDWEGGTITATKVGSITTKSSIAGKGNWDVVGINLSSQSFKAGQNTLGSVNIAGQVNASIWRIAGNTGAVSVGAFYSSALFVGIDGDASTTIAPLLAEFQVISGKTSTLAGFTVTGKGVEAGHASFSASQVAAGTLSNVSLRLVNADSLNAYGISAATRIGAYSRYTGQPAPNNYVKVNNKTLPFVYDSAGQYFLKIVAEPIAEG